MERAFTLEAAEDNVLNFTNSAIANSRGETDVSHTFKVDEIKLADRVSELNVPKLLPANTLWVSGDRRSYIIEEPPRYRSIRFRPSNKSSYSTLSTKRAEAYDLPLPWVVYGISPSSYHIPFVSHFYFARASIRAVSDSLWPGYIPNVFRTGAICTHTLPSSEDDVSYHVLINRAISEFWGTIFNNEVGDYSKMPLFRYLYESAVANRTNDVFYYASTLTPEKILRNFKWGGAISNITMLMKALLQTNPAYSFGSSPADKMMNDLLTKSLLSSLT